MSMSNTELLAQAQRIIAKAWADEAFKAALLADPAATLAQEGITLPPGLTLKVVENTPQTMHVILPQPPAEALSDEAVGAVAGGFISPFPALSLYCPGWNGNNPDISTISAGITLTTFAPPPPPPTFTGSTCSEP